MAYAYQKKKGGPWYVGFVDARGKPVQRKSSERTYRQALLEAQDLERKASKVRMGLEAPAPERITFAELAGRYLSTAAKQQRSFATIQQRVEQHLLPALGDVLADEVTPADIEALLGAKREAGYSPQTLEHLRTHAQAIFTFAIERAKVLRGENPAAAVPPVEVPEVEPVHVPEEFIPAIIAHVHERSRELFATAVYTGLRKGELFGLPKTAFDRTRRLLTIQKSHGGTTKGAKLRYVPVPLELVPYLEAQLARPEVKRSEFLFPDTSGGRRGAKEDLAGLFKSALRRADLVEKWQHVCRRKGCGHQEEHPDAEERRCPKCGMVLYQRAVALPYTFKHLRSTYGTYATERTSDIRFTQAVLGHGDVKVTEKHYAKLRAQRLVEQADKLSFGTYPALTGAPKEGEGAGPTEPNRPSIPSGSPSEEYGVRTRDLRRDRPDKPGGAQPTDVGTREIPETYDSGARAPGHTVPPKTTRATYPALTKVLSVRAVAERLGVSVTYVYSLIREGKLEALRSGARVRVPVDALEAFLAKSKP